jgi:hypothetical protein
MAEHCDCDPWAGGLISNGRHEQLEELQRRFDVLAKGDFGFSVEVVLDDLPILISARIRDIGQQADADRVQMAVEELTR